MGKTVSVVKDFMDLAYQCAEVCAETKAGDIRIYDVRRISVLTDFYVICSAHSDPHLRAVSGNVEKAFKKQKIYPQRVEGLPASHWMIVDYGGLVMHVLHPETRKFYALEELWTKGELLYQGGEEEI